MYFDRRLFSMTALTKGVRARMLLATLIGIVALPVGIARLMLTGNAMAQVFKGHTLAGLTGTFAAIVALILLRALLQYFKEDVSNRTAAIMKTSLRRRLYEHVLRLGPGHFDQ